MDDGLDDLRADVVDFSASLRELLQWEDELGGAGIPAMGRPEATSSSPSSPQGSPRPGPQPSPQEAPQRPQEDRGKVLRVLAAEAAECTKCGLHSGRTRSVFARGSAHAELLFVGEGPGANEDREGVPFVGRAGELLDKMVGAMGFGRDEVYVCNVVKCRPPDNRTPSPEESAACIGFLQSQIEVVQPKVIVALGRCAAENLGLATAGEGGWRGRWGEFQGIPSMPTYHPAYLLRSPEQKKPVWGDLKQVVARLGRALPRR